MASQPTADVTPDTTPAAEPSAPVNPLASLYKDDAPKSPSPDAPAAAVEPPQDDAQTDADAEPDADANTEPAVEPIAAPTSWAKDAKEVFAALPREAQEVIATRERDREAFVQAKSREVATTRQQVETEARQIIQTQAETYAAQIEAYLPQLAVAPPDIRYLQSNDPEHHAIYNEQDRAYRLATAQREQLSQQAQQARQQADHAAEQNRLMEAQADHQLLEQKLGTEWSDPSARAKLLGNLEPIAAELGYSPEVMSQAGAADILALKTALDWKAKADKFDQQNKARMIPVREAKQLPPTTRPGTNPGSGPRSTLDVLYPNDRR